MKKREFTEDELESIKYDYTVLKIPKSKLYKKYNTSYNRIKDVIVELNLDIGKLAKTETGRKRKYDVNDDFFSEIDTESKAYWLGFYYADGHVTDGNKVGLGISTEDRSHLVKLIGCIEGDINNIKDYENQTSYGLAKYSRVVVVSKKMYNDIVAKGVVPKKTDILNCDFISSLDDTLVRHFIRGYIDGDGSISGLNKKTYAIKICGTDEILRFIEQKLPINKNVRALEKRKSGQIVSQLSIGGTNNVVSILKYLYGDSNIYLDRKYEKAMRLLSELS